MKPNPAKRALNAGGIVFGSEVSRFRCDEVPRVFARAGLDFVFIDTEHTAFNRETVAGMIRAARLAGIVPVVRVAQAEYAFVAGMLFERVHQQDLCEKSGGQWMRAGICAVE